MNFSLLINYVYSALGKVGKDAIIVEKGENNEYCLQDIDKLSNTTTDDGEEDSSDEDSDDDSDPHKETPAPLELMAEVSFTCTL